METVSQFQLGLILLDTVNSHHLINFGILGNLIIMVCKTLPENSRNCLYADSYDNRLFEF